MSYNSSKIAGLRYEDDFTNILHDIGPDRTILWSRGGTVSNSDDRTSFSLNERLALAYAAIMNIRQTGKDYSSGGLTSPKNATSEDMKSYYRTVDTEIMGFYDQDRYDFSREMRYAHGKKEWRMSTIEERSIWLKLSSEFVNNAKGIVYIAGELCPGDTMLRFAEYGLLRKNKDVTHVASLKMDPNGFDSTLVHFEDKVRREGVNISWQHARAIEKIARRQTEEFLGRALRKLVDAVLAPVEGKQVQLFPDISANESAELEAMLRALDKNLSKDDGTEIFSKTKPIKVSSWKDPKELDRLIKEISAKQTISVPTRAHIFGDDPNVYEAQERVLNKALAKTFEKVGVASFLKDTSPDHAMLANCLTKLEDELQRILSDSKPYEYSRIDEPNIGPELFYRTAISLRENDWDKTRMFLDVIPLNPVPVPKDQWARQQKEEWYRSTAEAVESKFTGKRLGETIRGGGNYISRGSNAIADVKADYIMEIWFTINEIDRLERNNSHTNDVEIREDKARLQKLRAMADKYPELLYFDEPPTPKECKETIVNAGSWGEYLFDQQEKFDQALLKIQVSLHEKGLSVEEALAHHRDETMQPIKDIVATDPTRLVYDEETMELKAKAPFEKESWGILSTGLTLRQSGWDNRENKIKEAPDKALQTRYKTMIARLGFPEIVLDNTLSLKEKEAIWGMGFEDTLSRSKYQSADDIAYDLERSIRNNKEYGWPIEPAPDLESVQAPLNYTREKFMKLKERFLGMTQERELTTQPLE